MPTNPAYIFATKEELLNSIDSSTIQAGSEYQGVSKFYYLARYFMVIYEAQFQELPIQVWNEYRNALDHFVRQINNQSPEDNPESHKNKMEGHLQRATLDTLKLLIIRTIDSIKNTQSCYTKEVLSLVDNGTFIEYIAKERHNIEKLFTIAKVSDCNLGGGDIEDNAVLENYLDTAFLAMKVRDTLLNKQVDIARAEDRHTSIKSAGKTLSMTQSVLAGIIVYAIGLATPPAKEYVESWYVNYKQANKPVEITKANSVEALASDKGTSPPVKPTRTEKALSQ